MPDARAVAGVDVARSLASPLGRFLLTQLDPRAEQELAQLKQLTGFDPRSDLRELLVASPGPQADRRILVAAGSFDPARVLTLAQERGAQVSSSSGVDVITFASQGKHPSAVAFLSASLAVAGDSTSVRLAIDRHRVGGPPLDKELAGRISLVSAGADAWFVCLIPGQELAGVATPRAQLLAAIQQAVGSVQLGSTVVATTELTAVGPEQAAALADVVRLMASVARLNRNDPKAAALLELIEALEVSAAGPTVRLRLVIPEARLESLISALRPR